MSLGSLDIICDQKRTKHFRELGNELHQILCAISIFLLIGSQTGLVSTISHALEILNQFTSSLLLGIIYFYSHKILFRVNYYNRFLKKNSKFVCREMCETELLFILSIFFNYYFLFPLPSIIRRIL